MDAERSIGGSAMGLLKQYELLVGMYDNEMNRFWVRFNIFVGMEFAGLLAICVNPKFLIANRAVLFTVLLFCALLSLLVVFMVLRGITSARLFLQIMKMIEKKSPELGNLIEIIPRLDRVPQYVNFLIALIVAFLFSALWWAGFIVYGLGLCKLKPPI